MKELLFELSLIPIVEQLVFMLKKSLIMKYGFNINPKEYYSPMYPEICHLEFVSCQRNT